MSALVDGRSYALRIAQLWTGAPIDAREAVDITLEPRGDQIAISIDAPFHDDPAPPTPPGSTAGLWEHEVVELMLLGDDAHYLEIELAPRGHYLALELRGARNVVRQGMALSYQSSVDGARWRGRALLPASWLPPGCDRLNAFAIHGVGAQRRYLAWRPAGGAQPDFHQLAVFGSFDEL